MATVREVYSEANARLVDAEARSRLAQWRYEKVEADADAAFYREVKEVLRRRFKCLRTRKGRS